MGWCTAQIMVRIPPTFERLHFLFCFPLLIGLPVALDAQTSQNQAQELRLGYFPNLTHAQALYARATPALEKRLGIRIQWTAFNAGPTVIESLFANALDAAFVGPSPTINGYIQSDGQKFVVVAGSASGGAGMVVRLGAGIQTEGDFAGKTVATPQLGNTQDVAARVWLAGKGYRLRERGGDVSLVSLSNADQLTLFKKRQIDAAWTVEPWVSRLEIEGGGRLFLEEKTLWPEGRFVTTHLVVTRTFLADNRKTIKQLIEGLVEITQQINSNKTAAVGILNQQLRKETGKELRRDVIARALDRVEFTWDPLCASLRQSADAAHRIGFLRKEPKLDGIYSLALLQEVLKEKNLPAVEGSFSAEHGRK